MIYKIPSISYRKLPRSSTNVLNWQIKNKFKSQVYAHELKRVWNAYVKLTHNPSASSNSETKFRNYKPNGYYRTSIIFGHSINQLTGRKLNYHQYPMEYREQMHKSIVLKRDILQWEPDGCQPTPRKTLWDGKNIGYFKCKRAIWSR